MKKKIAWRSFTVQQCCREDFTTGDRHRTGKSYPVQVTWADISKNFRIASELCTEQTSWNSSKNCELSPVFVWSLFPEINGGSQSISLCEWYCYVIYILIFFFTAVVFSISIVILELFPLIHTFPSSNLILKWKLEAHMSLVAHLV